MAELLTKPLADITFADVSDFCADQIKEHIRLDYKREIPRTDKLAKLIASFANTQGGHILFGVEEVSDGVPEAKPQGQVLGNDPRQTIRNIISTEIWPPPVVEISDALQNPSDLSRAFVVVRVAQSDQIPHTVDGRTGIYVRVNDNSVPMPANIDQIAFMLNRQERSIAFQKSQRDSAFERLVLALNAAQERGLLLVSVGPRVASALLLGTGALRGSISSIFKSADTQDTNSPFNSDSPSGARDAIGWYWLPGGVGVSVDCFGNVSMAEKVREELPKGGIDRRHLLLHKDHLPVGDAPVEIAWAGTVAARVLVCLAAARNYFRQAGFAGPIEVAIQVRSSRRLWLATPGNLGGNLLLGGSLGDNSISLSVQLDSSALGNDIAISALPVLEKLAWAWGYVEPQGAQRLAHRGESQMQTATGQCPTCGEFHYPRHRGQCVYCYVGARDGKKRPG